jgi:peptide/nickel transport system permease protein
MLGIGGLYLFGLVFRVFPIGGMQDPKVPFNLPDFAAHLALPALILGLGYMAILMRYTRSAMLEVIGSLYITTAESKGLPHRRVVIQHAFRNALIPILTVIGLSLPDMVGGAVITETVFSWPGIGLMMVEGVSQRDYPMIMAVSLFVGVAVLAANLFTDVMYAAADPRIRY